MPARGRPRSRGHVHLPTFSRVLALARSLPPLMAILSLPLVSSYKRAPWCCLSPFPHSSSSPGPPLASLSSQSPRTTPSPFSAEGALHRPGFTVTLLLQLLLQLLPTLSGSLNPLLILLISPGIRRILDVFDSGREHPLRPHPR